MAKEHRFIQKINQKHANFLPQIPNPKSCLSSIIQKTIIQSIQTFNFSFLLEKWPDFLTKIKDEWCQWPIKPFFKSIKDCSKRNENRRRKSERGGRLIDCFSESVYKHYFWKLSIKWIHSFCTMFFFLYSEKFPIKGYKWRKIIKIFSCFASYLYSYVHKHLEYVWWVAYLKLVCWFVWNFGMCVSINQIYCKTLVKICVTKHKCHLFFRYYFQT